VFNPLRQYHKKANRLDNSLTVMRFEELLLRHGAAPQWFYEWRAVRDFLSKTRTQSVRLCRCMLCDRARIPKGWDLSKRYQIHDLTHARAANVPSP
jgi:hypothetical protein